MAESLNDVRAFRGLCYDGARVGAVADCLAQPYDVIGPTEQAEYLARHRCSIVALTLPPQSEDGYLGARRTLDSWLTGSVLVQSPEDSLWLYEQSFTLDGRARRTRGLLAVVRLRDFEERRVLPHEKVMARPVEDRMRLTLATEAQLEPIWGFYRQPDLDLAPLAAGELRKRSASSRVMTSCAFCAPGASGALTTIRCFARRRDGCVFGADSGAGNVDGGRFSPAASGASCASMQNQTGSIRESTADRSCSNESLVST